MTWRMAPFATQREHSETQEVVQASTPSDDAVELLQGPNEAAAHFADFIPIDVDEDDAIEEAIRQSLVKEPEQSLQDSTYTYGSARTLTKEEIIGIVRAHSERVFTTA